MKLLRNITGYYVSPENETRITNTSYVPVYIISPIFYLQVVIAWISFAGFLRIVTQSTKREFRFYFAKACCKIISEKENEFDKMKYLLLLLDSYNRFLYRNIKMGINSIEEIYSIIYYKDTKERNQIIGLICGCLEDEKLKLAKYLSSIYQIPDSKFYVREPFAQRMKLIGTILATMIPIIISTLALLHKKLGLG
jgi:hypothetical protein